MIRRAAVFIALVSSFATFANAQAKAPAAKRVPARSPSGKAAPVWDPALVNNAETHPDLTGKAIGSASLRAQILLDRANFSVGEIDGTLGSNTETSLAGFRMKYQLQGTGIDQPVWQALNADQEPVLVPYTISAADLKGPFVQVPADMVAKAKLTHLGYASPLEALAEKFHIAPALLRQLNPGKTFKRAGEKLMVPNVRQTLTTPAAKVVVSKAGKTVKALDEMGNVLAQYPSTSGSEHDPLPLGEWKVTGVAKNPPFHYNPDLFWDAKPEQTKETIAPGPRNPVGVVWIDISKEHYGIHGTPSPSAIGYAQSHGCIRLTNWDALELAGLVKAGTPVSLVE
ncbi:MAG: L,D-transpeptidase [Acidobacteriota bacterium]